MIFKNQLGRRQSSAEMDTQKEEGAATALGLSWYPFTSINISCVALQSLWHSLNIEQRTGGLQPGRGAARWATALWEMSVNQKALPFINLLHMYCQCARAVSLYVCVCAHGHVATLDNSYAHKTEREGDRRGASVFLICGLTV